MQKGYLINQYEMQIGLQQIAEYQDEAVALLDEEEPMENNLRRAYHYHGMAQSVLILLRGLELISISDFGKVFNKQLEISERINELWEER